MNIEKFFSKSSQMMLKNMFDGTADISDFKLESILFTVGPDIEIRCLCNYLPQKTPEKWSIGKFDSFTFRLRFNSVNLNFFKQWQPLMHGHITINSLNDILVVNLVSDQKTVLEFTCESIEASDFSGFLSSFAI